jgi:hypothetical protein
MPKTPDKVNKSRRGFLKLAAVAAPAAVAGGAAGPVSAASDDAPKGAGLRKTDHVKKYLASARF